MFHHKIKNLFIITFLVFLFSPLTAFGDDKEDDKKEKKLTGLAEAGITIENGNSDSQSYYGKFKIDYKFKEKWQNILNARAENRKDYDQRSKEDYRVNNQTRYSITKLNYTLLELEYIDDRYSGYDHRITETFGLGRNLIKKDNLNLSIQSSVGARQTKFNDGDKDDSWVIKFGSDFEWKINHSISLNENIDVSFDKDTRITVSDTNFKFKIAKSLYLKFSLFIENKSDVQIGIKNTDSTTRFIIGYNF